MKQNMCLFAAVLLAALVGTGCQTPQVSIADHTPVVVLSVMGNPSLPWKEKSNPNADTDEETTEGEGVLTNLANKVLKADDVEYLTGYDRLDYAVDSFRALLQENAGATVVEEDALFNAKSYMLTKESVLNILEAKISATKYKKLPKVGAKRARMIMQDTDAKSMLFADFVFQKTNIKGNKWTGEVAAHVTLKIKLLDEHGKELVNAEYAATSLESLPIKSRKYDKDALVELYPATIDAVINQFIVNNL